jgi:hypothetical protein
MSVSGHTGAVLPLSHAGKIFRLALLVLPACLVFAGRPPAASAQEVVQIAGVWRGNSVCAVADSPCRNEVNVYRFSEMPGKPNRFSCTGSKIVDGKEIVMGSSEWTYDSSKHLLQTVGAGPVIRLTLDHDSLDGALTQPDGTIYRRIHLKRSRE